MHNFSVSNSFSTASISTTTSQDSQLGTADGQHPQGSFMGLLTTPDTPAEFTQILSTYYQQDELRLLSDIHVSNIGASKTNPFEALATHQTVTFGDDNQGQSASPLSLSNEPSRSQKSSQSVDDVLPIVREEQSPDPTDKWIMMSGNKKRPYQCGYEGCGRKYSIKAHLQTHLVTHTGDSKLRCHLGDCAGIVIYRDVRALTWHVHTHHTFERLYGCELCGRRFRLQHHLKRHKENVHFTKSKKISSKPQSTSESSSATSTSTMTSGVSQPESAAGQRQQGSYVGISTTINSPNSMQIPTDYQQQTGLSVLAEVNTSQINPLEALATHLAVTFDDDHQGRSACSLSLHNEPARSQRSSQPVDDVAPIVRQQQSTDPTNKWIMMSGDKKRPYQCGYKGCGRKYSIKAHLQTHFVTHIGDSKLRCYLGECAGSVIYQDTRLLTQHIHSHHTFEKIYRCEICDKRFRRKHDLKRHKKNVHFIKSKKKSPKPQSVSESSSATTATHTASTSVITSGVSLPESPGQHQQGSFVDLSKTVRTPESTLIPVAEHQFTELRLLAKVSASQINPFEALATQQTVTFDDDDQGRPASSLSLANEASRSYKSSQPVVDGTAPVVREEQGPDPTDEWIIVDKSQPRPYKCGYPRGCDKSYLKRCQLIWHFIKHTGKSKFKCPHPECVGNEYFGTRGTLNRHITTQHTSETPFQCDSCNRRFARKDYLKDHRKRVHGIEDEKKSPKRKRK